MHSLSLIVSGSLLIPRVMAINSPLTLLYGVVSNEIVVSYEACDAEGETEVSLWHYTVVA